MFAGFAILLPLLTLFFFPEELNNAKYFILPGVLIVLIGYWTNKFFADEKKERMKKNDEAAVIFIGLISVILRPSYKLCKPPERCKIESTDQEVLLWREEIVIRNVKQSGKR
jgi:hypothetical protein